jgi:lysyl-tRNA synthetase class 2
LPVVAALAALGLLWLLVQAEPDAPEADGEVRNRVASLCCSVDGDAMAPFTRRQDKSYVFSPDGRAVLGYRVVFGVCITGPGPVGAPDAHGAALDAWLERCRVRGWRPAMIGASDAVRSRARAFGLRGIHIGDEAQVPVPTFRLDRPAMRNVRQAVQRTHNSGVTVTIDRAGALAERARHELAGVVDVWRRGHDEIGFAMTMDRLVDGTYPDAVVVVARHDDRVVGFQRYFLARGGASLSLDVMPRLRNAPNGVNERLIAEVIAWGAACGVEDVSLNFAAFRTLFESEESVPRRFLRWGAHRLDPFINVESLYRFNAKFRPEWVARHVLYRSALDLPAVLVASLRVEFGHPISRSPEAATNPVAGRPVGPVLT